MHHCVPNILKLILVMANEIKTRVDTIGEQFDSIVQSLYKFIDEHKEYATVICGTKDGENKIPSGSNIDLFVVIDFGKL